MCCGEFISSFAACLGKIGHTMGNDSSLAQPHWQMGLIEIAEFPAAPFYEIQEGYCLVPQPDRVWIAVVRSELKRAGHTAMQTLVPSSHSPRPETRTVSRFPFLWHNGDSLHANEASARANKESSRPWILRRRSIRTSFDGSSPIRRRHGSPGVHRAQSDSLCPVSSARQW